MIGVVHPPVAVAAPPVNVEAKSKPRVTFEFGGHVITIRGGVVNGDVVFVGGAVVVVAAAVVVAVVVKLGFTVVVTTVLVGSVGITTKFALALGESRENVTATLMIKIPNAMTPTAHREIM